MDILDPRALLAFARDTLGDPKGAAQRVLDLQVPRPALYTAFTLMVVGALIIGEVAGLLVPPPEPGPFTAPPPIVLGLLQGAMLFLAVHAITYIGRAFGGTGEFDGALALMVWLQFVFLLVQVVQLATLLIMPPVALIIVVLSIGLFFWLLSSFITVLHGFTSVGMVLVMTMVSLFSIVFVLAIILSMLGISIDTGGG